MSNNRNWTWENNAVDEEQAELIEPTLNALAAEWSQIHNEIEQEGWRNQARYDDEGGGPEDPECPLCGGEQTVGVWHARTARVAGTLVNVQRPFCYRCHEYRPDGELYGIVCPECNGDGVDRKLMAEWAKAARQKEANRQVRIDIIEGMLARYGARMMRPYEHWNEDERYMEYMECGRFGE